MGFKTIYIYLGYNSFTGIHGDISLPIGSMYGIYANIWGILMGSMLPYIAAPWIRHGLLYLCQERCLQH